MREEEKKTANIGTLHGDHYEIPKDMESGAAFDLERAAKALGRIKGNEETLAGVKAYLNLVRIMHFLVYKWSIDHTQRENKIDLPNTLQEEYKAVIEEYYTDETKILPYVSRASYYNHDSFKAILNYMARYWGMHLLNFDLKAIVEQAYQFGFHDGTLAERIEHTSKEEVERQLDAINEVCPYCGSKEVGAYPGGWVCAICKTNYGDGGG